MPIYASEDRKIIVPAHWAFAEAGRYLLRPGNKERVLSICSAIGTDAYALLRAGVVMGKYYCIEYDEKSKGILRRRLEKLLCEFPSQSFADTFSEFDTAFPEDVFDAADLAEVLFRDMPRLPTLLSLSPPCTGGSGAGPGHGLRRGEGTAVFQALRIMAALFREYERRGLWVRGQTDAPFGFLWETAPVVGGEDRPAAEELQLVYLRTMGPARRDDAARRGSVCRRFTQLHTNLGAAEDWQTPSTQWQCPLPTLKSLLRTGEQLQIVKPFHGQSEFPNTVGQRALVLPKVLRSHTSHGWRRDEKGPGCHGLGVTLLDGNLVVPEVQALEKGMGFPADWTRFSWMKSSTGNVWGVELSEAERWARLGDVFDPNLAVHTWQDRLESSARVLQARRVHTQEDMDGAAESPEDKAARVAAGKRPARPMECLAPQTPAPSRRRDGAGPSSEVADGRMVFDPCLQ